MVSTEPIRVNSSQVMQAETSDQAQDVGRCSPAPLASKLLFAPIAGLLAELGEERPADIDALNRLLARSRWRPRTHDGRALRFVHPDNSPLGYEQRIFQAGEVVTRADNWHDCFNALVWLTFPRTKASLNALHVREMRQACGTNRGPLRDAATQFDESGIVVASADSSLLDLLARRCWKELFWTRRADVVRDMRCLVFGHGLYDALRAPFYRMCGRAAMIEVERTLIDGDSTALSTHVDDILAGRFADGGWYPRPRALLALPLLGIPGVTKENESPEYYHDTVQFRPLPSWADPGGATVS